jgi:hypothetical protein
MSALKTLVASTLLCIAFATPAAAQPFTWNYDIPPIQQIQWEPEPTEVWIYGLPYQDIKGENEIYYWMSCGNDCDEYIVSVPSYTSWGWIGGFIQF